MKKILQYSLTALAIALLSGCAGAAFNRIQVSTARNVSVGEELIKLQEAHEKGVISDEEYEQAKQSTLMLLEEFGGIELE